MLTRSFCGMRLALSAIAVTRQVVQDGANLEAGRPVDGVGEEV